MKTYPSPTVNGGKTVILESLTEAFVLGRDHLGNQIQKNSKSPPTSELTLVSFPRDEKTASSKSTYEAFGLQLQRRSAEFDACVEIISRGDPKFNELIAETAETLVDLAAEIEPQLQGSYESFERAEDGLLLSPDLFAAGDDRPFFRQRLSGETKGSAGRTDGYRIVLSTDTTWFGKPEDNAAIVSALILCLQRFGPVELWIQQGWCGPGSDDGVTLFQIDYSSAFEPSQIAFWCGDNRKDRCFAFEINMALGRTSAQTAKYPEIPADLFLRGDWMKVYGVDDGFLNRLHTEKLDIMARWIAETAIKIVSADSEGEATETSDNSGLGPQLGR